MRRTFTTVAKLLRLLGYSLQANVKSREGRQHPDRDAQFQRINRAVKAVEAAQGRKRECRDHARQALALASGHDFAPQPEIGEALGLLELGAARPQEARQDLEAATRAFEVATAERRFEGRARR